MKSLLALLLSFCFVPYLSLAQVRDTTVARLYLDSLKMQLKPRAFDKASQYGNKALEIYKEAFGEDHAKTAVAYYWLGIVNFEKRDLRRSMEIQQKALDIRRKVLGRDHAETADSYHFVAMLHNAFQDYQKAIELYTESLDIRLKVLGVDHPHLVKSYNNLGGVYLRIEDYHRAFEYQNKSLDLLIKLNGVQFPGLHMPYNNLGKINIAIGRYSEGLEFYEKALELQLNNFGKKDLSTSRTYEYIGAAYIEILDFRKALEYYQEALNIRLKILGEDNDMVAILYNQIGICHKENGAFEKAGIAYEKSHDILIKIYGKEHLYLADNYSNRSKLYAKLDLQKALEFNDKVIGICLNILGPYNDRIARAYLNRGWLFQSNKKIPETIEMYNKAVEVLKKASKEVSPNLSSAYINLGEIYYQYNGDIDKGLEYLTKALEVDLKLYGEVHGNVLSTYALLGEVNLLKGNELEAMAYFDKSYKSLELMQKTYSQHSFNDIISKEGNYKVFENGIKNIIAGNKKSPEKINLESAFHIAEQSKSNQLILALNHAKAKSFAGIPEDVLNLEQKLKEELNQYDKKRIGLIGAGVGDDDSLLNVYNSKIFTTKREYEDLIKNIENDYPVYFNLKHQFDTLTIESIRTNLLNDNQMLIEYLVGEKDIFVFLISPKKFQIFEIKKDFPLEELIRQMRDGLYHYHMTGFDDETTYLAYSDTFSFASNALYEKLIAPFKNELTEKLIIIPDGVLSYIPFEALLSEVPDENHQYKNHSYLIKDHQISYSYSATSLQELKQKKNKATKGLLAFAPSFKEDKKLLVELSDRRNNMGSLRYSVPEIENIQSLLGGDIYKGAQATEDRFSQMAGDYSILHLATHGKVNDKAGDFSFLAFTEVDDSIENEFLYLRDLYNLQLNADMVVLSACETGLGKLQRGEGIVSLARGFSYAGAKSIITTLWSVSDEKTKDLMIPFYENIKSGMEKDEALRKAKLDYIEQHSHTDAHPFFWAGLIPVGDMEPIEMGDSFFSYAKYGFLVIVLFMILIWLYKRRK